MTELELARKLDGKCPRCGQPAGDGSDLCEEHRQDAAARWRAWAARARPKRRAARECLFCGSPSRTVRCEVCKEKRKAWDARVCTPKLAC